MSTTTEQVKLTIPAAHLEDVRTALADEIRMDGDRIHADQDAVLEVLGNDLAGNRREDLALAVRTLREDVQLFDQILDATDDVTVTGDEGAIRHVLDAVVRVLSGRLADEAEYSPVPMDKVLEISEGLRWATTEANRIEVQEGAGRAHATVAQG